MRYGKRSIALAGGQVGLTLIEVLAAMIILSLGLLTLLPMATISMDANNSARDTDQVIARIQNRIEQMRNAPVIQSGSETDTTTGMLTTWWTEDEAGGLIRLIVEVSWESETGIPHNQRGVTYLYRE